jgi:hypothetical protein
MMSVSKNIVIIPFQLKIDLRAFFTCGIHSDGPKIKVKRQK